VYEDGAATQAARRASNGSKKGAKKKLTATLIEQDTEGVHGL
jgi:hypothetical protein